MPHSRAGSPAGRPVRDAPWCILWRAGQTPRPLGGSFRRRRGVRGRRSLHLLLSSSEPALIHTAAIVGIVTLVALLVFFWRRSGAGSGRTFGNRIASHIGMRRSVFHSILESGVKESSRALLASLEKSTPDLDRASVALGPTLARGIERLEARFGPQDMIDQAKPIVARLVAASEQTP